MIKEKKIASLSFYTKYFPNNNSRSHSFCSWRFPLVNALSYFQHMFSFLTFPPLFFFFFLVLHQGTTTTYNFNVHIIKMLVSGGSDCDFHFRASTVRVNNTIKKSIMFRRFWQRFSNATWYQLSTY